MKILGVIMIIIGAAILGWKLEIKDFGWAILIIFLFITGAAMVTVAGIIQ